MKLGLLLLLFFASHQSFAAKTVVTAVAQVSDHVITSREVQISYILDKAMDTKQAQEKTVNKTQWILDPKSESFQKHLAQVMLEMVVNYEAENFSIGDVDSNQTKAFLNHIEGFTKDWKEWKSLDVKPVEVEQMVGRKLRSKNFLKFKGQSSGIVISDEEAKAYYDKNKSKFGNSPYPQFQASIKEFLSQNQSQEKLKDWFEILKRKYRVKVLSQVE